MKHDPKGNHFFATSAATWITTGPHRDLETLIKNMNREGLTWALWFVPLPHDADYEIENFRPVVAGAVHCCSYRP